MVQAQTFSDSFESYTLTNLGPQSPDWRTWSGAGGGADDVVVVNTDNHTTAGAQSLYFSSLSATGGPQDCVLPFGASPLTTGQFTYTMWMKVPTGKTAYFNFQGTTTMGGLYTLDCFMDNTGNISVQNSGTQVGSGCFRNPGGAGKSIMLPEKPHPACLSGPAWLRGKLDAPPGLMA